MTDIIRLEENGVPQYIQTVPEAVIGLDEYSSPILLNGTNTVSYGQTITLSEPITNFDHIEATFTYRGNRITAKYNPVSNMDLRVCIGNLNDSPTSAGWDMCEAIFSITNGRTLKGTSSKVVDQAGAITNQDTNLLLAYLVGTKVHKK